MAYLLIYEAFTLFNAVPGDTISEIHWRLVDDYPVVSFLFGVLMGHLFWARKIK